MLKIHRGTSAIVAFLVLAFSGYVVGRAAEPLAAEVPPAATETEQAPAAEVPPAAAETEQAPAADAPPAAAETEEAPAADVPPAATETEQAPAADAPPAAAETERAPAAAPQPAEGKPETERLENDFRVWLEAGDHLPLVDARRLSMLELLDLDNAEFTWLTELKLRVNCEFKPDLEVPASERMKTRAQLEVLIADPQAGFLKQTLPNFTYFSGHTTDGRQRMHTVMTLVEALLGPKPVVAVERGEHGGAGAGEGDSGRAGRIQPTPIQGASELGACWGSSGSVGDPCSAIVSCCAPSRGCGWLPRSRSRTWGWCVARPPVVSGGCCGSMVSWQLSSPRNADARGSMHGKPAASPIVISQADVIGLLVEAGSNASVQFVSVTAGAELISPQERAIADNLFRLGSQAYWSGEYPRALERLGMAADLNKGDARIWYFTGLAQSALGQRHAATASLARAVQLHARQPRDRSILESLQRVQGPQRDELQRALLLAPSIRPAAPPPPRTPASDTPLIAKTR